MPKENLVSIIIPVFNRPEELIRAVASVLQQDYRPIEIIIVDDGSTDETANVAAEIENKNSSEVRLIKQKNTGAGLARQAGLDNARGEFIQYLDSDDIILPGKLTRQVGLLRNNPDCSLALGLTQGITMMNSKGQSAESCPSYSDYLYPEILNYRWWTTSTPLYKSDIAKSARWSDEIVLEDWDYEFQIAAEAAKYCFMPEYYVDKSDDGDDQLSHYKDSKRELWLMSKANVMQRIIDRVYGNNLVRKSESIERFINKIINTGEEALEYSRYDIAQKMSSLAIRCMKDNFKRNFLKRLVILKLRSILLPLKWT